MKNIIITFLFVIFLSGNVWGVEDQFKFDSYKRRLKDRRAHALQLRRAMYGNRYHVYRTSTTFINPYPSYRFNPYRFYSKVYNIKHYD